MLVSRSAPTAARKVLSSLTLICPFKSKSRADNTTLHRRETYILSSATLDSRQNVRFPPVEGRAVRSGFWFKGTNQSWGWNHVASGRWRGPADKHFRKAEEANFKPNLSFFTGLSIAEADVCGVTFIGLYGTVGFIAIRDFSFWGESDLWSDVWSAINGVVCLSILLEGRATASNNFTKWRQGVRMALKSAQETSTRHIWGRKTLFQMR